MTKRVMTFKDLLFGIKSRKLNLLDDRVMFRAFNYGLISEVYNLMRANGLFHQSLSRARVAGNLMIMTLGFPQPTKLDICDVLKTAGIDPFRKFNTLYHSRSRKSSKKIDRKNIVKRFFSTL